jgi:hypothetical protein
MPRSCREQTVAGSIEWARQVRGELRDEIRMMTARGRSGSRAAEVIGLAPEQDHLQDLKRRLAQVERLIEAMSEGEPVAETGWPADLGDPSTAGALKREIRRPS